MHPEGLRPEVARCDLCFIPSHNTNPKELKKKKKELLLQGICCNVRVNRVTAAAQSSGTWQANVQVASLSLALCCSIRACLKCDGLGCLKFLLLPVWTVQVGNALLINYAADVVPPSVCRLQLGKLASPPAPNHHANLTQQETPAKNKMVLVAPAMCLVLRDTAHRAEAWDPPTWYGVCSTSSFLRLRHSVKEQRCPSQS